jgi:hypothetical protein
MRLDFNSLGKCREPRVMRDIAVDLDTGSNAFTASGYQARVDLQGVPDYPRVQGVSSYPRWVHGLDVPD